MKEIISPKINESSTGGIMHEGYEKFIVPSGLKIEDQMKIHTDILERVVHKEIELDKRIDDYKDKVDRYKIEVEKQASKNIEIIGIFSAILALLIIDVSIIKSAESFLAAILLVIALTCSMAIFVVLIHSFFAPEGMEKFGKKSFQIPMVILIGLVILGIIVHFKNIDLY